MPFGPRALDFVLAGLRRPDGIADAGLKPRPLYRPALRRGDGSSSDSISSLGLCSPTPSEAGSSKGPLAALPTGLPSWSDVYLDPTAVTLGLRFAGFQSPLAPSSPEANGQAPPAFFPLQRIGFSPLLSVHTTSGLPLEAIGGLSLSVAAVVEVPKLDRRTGDQVVDPQTGERQWRARRAIVDLVTDLTPALRVWRRDSAAKTALGGGQDPDVLPMGDYSLPLSMRIPSSHRLPPSFSCKHFSISYTITVAVFSSALDPTTGKPLFLKSFSTPFDLLPSTLPSPSVNLPCIDHQRRTRPSPFSAAFWDELKIWAVSPTDGRDASSGDNDRPMLAVIPSLPAGTSFSPSAGASIPLSLEIWSQPHLERPVKVYVRVALVRTLHLHDGTREVKTESAEAVDTAEVASCCRILSPSDMAPGPTRLDLAVPFFPPPSDAVWIWGYSSSISLKPEPLPPTAPSGDGSWASTSWFAPHLLDRAPLASEYARHLHVSNRFALVLQVAFVAASSPGPTLSEGRLVLPSSSSEGEVITRKILVEIGSVAEPLLECLSPVPSASAPWPRMRTRQWNGDRGTEEDEDEGPGPAESTATESAERLRGLDDVEAWLVAPPDYSTSLISAPAYGSSPGGF